MNPTERRTRLHIPPSPPNWRGLVVLLLWAVLVMVGAAHACPTPEPPTRIERGQTGTEQLYAVDTRQIASKALTVAENAMNDHDRKKIDATMVRLFCFTAYIADRKGFRVKIPSYNPWQIPRCDLCGEGYACNTPRIGEHQDE